MIVFHELRLYWDWAGSNVGAMPACGLVAVVSAVVFRRPLTRLSQRLKDTLHEPVRAVRAEVAELRAVADKAHRIAADTYRHHTGSDHPDAPDPS